MASIFGRSDEQLVWRRKLVILSEALRDAGHTNLGGRPAAREAGTTASRGSAPRPRFHGQIAAF